MINCLAKKKHFIDRSILAAVSFLKEATLYEDHAVGPGFLQSLDPRIKTITFLLFILTVVSLKTAAAVAWLYLLCLILAVCSNVALGFFLLRTWVFIPLFSLFIAIPALFSFITPGKPLWVFFIMGIKLIITCQGLDSAVLFVTRTAASVSFVVLLSLTTRHGELLKVLRILGVPRVFVLTVSMCYRYLYLFAELIENVFTAVKSRVGIAVCQKRGQHIVAWNIANIWGRAYRMNEDVYNAMLSRGYTGEPKLLSRFHTTTRDWLWLVISMLVCGAFYWGQI
jgi:cobalt/nickel transport system permease protein